MTEFLKRTKAAQDAASLTLESTVELHRRVLVKLRQVVDEQLAKLGPQLKGGILVRRCLRRSGDVFYLRLSSNQFIRIDRLAGSESEWLTQEALQLTKKFGPLLRTFFKSWQNFQELEEGLRRAAALYRIFELQIQVETQRKARST